MSIKKTIMSKTTFIDYENLLEKIGDYARKAGRVTTKPVLLLYYVMMSKDTPWNDKMLILSTLSYVVFPIDILDAKRLPIIGCDRQTKNCQGKRKSGIFVYRFS